jgi:hypothetical protein
MFVCSECCVLSGIGLMTRLGETCLTVVRRPGVVSGCSRNERQRDLLGHCTMVMGSTQPLTEMSTKNVTWGLRRPVPRVDNLTNFMCGMSLNLGISTSWNLQSLFRLVQGFFYMFMKTYVSLSQTTFWSDWF